MNRPLYVILLVLTVVATAAGVATLVPVPTASYPNPLGYRALCTFSPASSFFCLTVAGISCLLRISLARETSGTRGQRLSRHFRAVLPISLVLLLGIGSSVWFAVAKGRYRDASTEATTRQGE